MADGSRGELVRQIQDALEAQGVMLETEVWRGLEVYERRLVERNREVNLTAVTDAEGVYWKHFYDSLVVLGLPEVPQAGFLVDVGSGAGFPGLVLALARPGFSVSLLDALRKRVWFLEEVRGELGLTRVRVVHGRAEEYGRRPGWRESFDMATARAVAQMSVLAELLLPFVRVGGMAMAWKGPDVEEELEGARGAIRRLGGEVEAVHRYELPYGMGGRSVVIVRKISATPTEYPRRPGVPEKRPLT
ncbi:MAG: 16S rRNA (guanine(527)-N(7))-methyltransferase RsmG [Kyrpidia tusciae]|nr:16S rRNA (guanine(527)-N(7))-methyltransferase RsmG [Kyrpidia tusciae]MBE3552335.1 16S rRNA (guanine(527)-N(7))-methyltransferase RsmG [Kyrpidia tusciae]